MRKLLGGLFVAAFAIVSQGATNITTDVTLDADADWRAAGQVTIAAGVTVDLNGHNLKVAGLAGEGCLTTTAASVCAGSV